MVDDDLVALEAAERIKRRKIDAALDARTTYGGKPREDGEPAASRGQNSSERFEGLQRENQELNATVSFSPEASPPANSLFHTPPEQAETRIAQSEDSWHEHLVGIT